MKLVIKNKFTSDGKIPVICEETRDVVYEAETVTEAIDYIEENNS